MEFNGSFGEREFEEEEEINLKDLVKMKENEISIDNTQKYDDTDTHPKNNGIFNSVFATEIENNNDSTKKIEFLQIQLIKEKINYSLLNIYKIINNHIDSYKLFFIYELKYNLSQKYSKLLKAEILYSNIKNKLEHLIHLFKFINTFKLKKCFTEIKNYSYLKKRQEEYEVLRKKEKENQIQNLNYKLNNIENNLAEANKKINILNNTQKKVSNDNKELKLKINQLNEKINHLTKEVNSLKESISNKKIIYNNILNKNQEEIIQNLTNLIEQKENEKKQAMIDVDNFYQSMDIVLSQYESISETILSNCNINSNK